MGSLSNKSDFSNRPGTWPRSIWHLERLKLTVLFAILAAANHAAVEVTSATMTVGGGTAFAKRNDLERYLRDARAGGIMGPTDNMCKLSIAGVHLACL